MMNESYEERTVIAKPFPGYDNRKQGRKELLRNFHYALNSIISIADDLDKSRAERESINKKYTVINNQDMLGLSKQLYVSCKHLFDIVETIAQEAKLLDLTSTVYEEGIIENMRTSMLDDIYKHIGYTRKVKKDEQPVNQVSR